MESTSLKTAADIPYLKHIRIICEICGNEEELKNFIPHLMTHTGVSDCLFCTKCELKFTSQDDFYKHMKKFHAVRNNCQFCCNYCYSKPLLFKHVKNVHGDIEMLKIDKPQLEAHLDDLHKAFQTASEDRRKRKNERRRQRKDQCKICGKTYQKGSLKNYHMKTHTRENPTTCDVCGKKFSSWKGMRAHKTLHRDPSDAQHQCHVCSKMFFIKSSLDIHLQKHAGVVTHRCKECLKLFTGSYEKHVEAVHRKDGFTLDDIPTCEWCGKRFPNKFLLKRHLWSHTKEKVACEICNKKVSPGTIDVHMRQVHMQGSKRRKEMTQCRVCDKVVSKSYLSLHMTFHSDKKFQCEDCGKCFPLKHNLDAHRTSHTELRPYSCDLCEKTFKLPHHMRAHRKTHKDA